MSTGVGNRLLVLPFASELGRGIDTAGSQNSLARGFQVMMAGVCGETHLTTTTGRRLGRLEVTYVLPFFERALYRSSGCFGSIVYWKGCIGMY